VTQSGQEPPEKGRGAPGESANGSARQQKHKAKRRRRRRNGKGQAKQQGTSLEIALQLAERSDSVSQADQQGKNGRQPSARKKRRHRNAGDRSENGAESLNAGTHAEPRKSSEVGGGDGGSDGLADTQADKISPKGLKAGRRRNRRRRKNLAGKNHSEKPNANTPHSARNIGVSDQLVGTSETEQVNTHEGQAGPAPSHKPVHGENGQVRRSGERYDGNRHRRSRANEGEDQPPLYAALDLGTNNCRLLIARPEERGFRVVDAYSRIVRLGEGIGKNQRLGEEAMERAVDALANCHRKLAERGVMRSRLIATEACRAAENGMEFISRVQKETGLALEVVDRETEARLAVAGCVSLVDPNAKGVILFDIGGGSSEIVWLDLRNRCGARGYALTRFVRSWTSLPLGVVNLSERHGGVHVTPEVFEAMVDDVADHLQHFNLSEDLADAIAEGEVHMLGTSGTVTTLAGVHLGLRRYDRRRVDGTWLTDLQVSTMIDQLRDMSYEERVENPCIGGDRADLVLAGCAILEAIRRRWTCPRLRVADRGLREGILTELMAADGVWSRKPGRFRRRGGPNRGKS